MAIATTTATDLIAALATRIQTITPAYEEYQDITWKYFEDFQIEGAELRTFAIYADPEQVEPEGIWGANGVEYFMDLRVVAAYSGLAPHIARRMIGADGKDLWVCLFNSVPLVTGMLPFRENSYDVDAFGVDFGSEEDDNEREEFLTQFRFRVQFKALDTVSLSP